MHRSNLRRLALSPLAGIEFNPTVLMVKGVRTPLGGPPEKSITIVAEEDIRPPPPQNGSVR